MLLLPFLLLPCHFASLASMAQLAGVWRKAEPFLHGLHLVPHGPHCLAKVLALTLDRAVLLVELSERAIARLNVEFPGVGSVLSSARTSASREVHVSSSPLRFLPSSVLAVMEMHDIPWSQRLSRARPPHWTWLELIAAGGPSSPEALGAAIEFVFRESELYGILNSPTAPSVLQTSSTQPFSIRCQASDCSYLDLRWPLDEAESLEPRWSGLPRERLGRLPDAYSSQADLRAIDMKVWRFPGHLTLERSLLVMLTSVKGSWKSIRSGWWAWGLYAKATRPLSDPFQVTLESLAGFSSCFQNPDTLSQYYGHLRLALRLCGRSVDAPPDRVAQLMRGLRKHRVCQPLTRLGSKMVRDIVLELLNLELIPFARLCVVARSFLFRVQNELFPLQLDGRQGLPPQSMDWHSVVAVSNKKVEVTLRTRKNSPSGAVLRRACLCKESPDVLCGSCALGAQVRHHVRTGRGGRDRLFELDPGRCLALLREVCSRLRLPSPSWHAFRRGMASDMLASGSSLSAILRAGGWRSAAFLRYLRSQDLDEREALDFTLANSDPES